MKVKFSFLLSSLSIAAIAVSAQTQLTSVTKTLNNVTTTQAEYKYIGQARPMVTDTGRYIFEEGYVPSSQFADSVFYPNNGNQLRLGVENTFGSNKVSESKKYNGSGNFDGITYYEYHANGALKTIREINDDSTYITHRILYDNGKTEFYHIEEREANGDLKDKTTSHYLYDNDRLITQYRLVEFGISTTYSVNADSTQYYYANANSANYDSAYTYSRMVSATNTPNWQLNKKNYRVYNSNGQLEKDSTINSIAYGGSIDYTIKNFEIYTDSTLEYTYRYYASTPNNVRGGLERIIIDKAVPEGKLSGYLFFDNDINSFRYGYLNLLDYNSYLLTTYDVIRDTNGVFTYEPLVTINRHANNNINYIDVVESDTLQYRVNYNYASDNTNIDKLTSIEFNIYPNPSSGIINIDAKDLIKYNVEIYNAVGQLLAVYGNSPTSINISNQPVGNYILKINDLIKGESGIQRVNKQ